MTSTDWMHLGLTWSRVADQVKVFYNGAQSGATATGLNAWAGVVTNTQCLIGAASTAPTLVTSGTIAHVAVWNRALTPAEIAALAVL